MSIRSNKTNQVITVATRLFIIAGRTKHDYVKHLFANSYENPHAEVDAWID